LSKEVLSTILPESSLCADLGFWHPAIPATPKDTIKKM